MLVRCCCTCNLALPSPPHPQLLLLVPLIRITKNTEKNKDYSLDLMLWVNFLYQRIPLPLPFLFVYTYRNYYTVQKEPSYSRNQRRDSSFPLWFKVFTIGYHYIFLLVLYPQEFVTLFRKKQHSFFSRSNLKIRVFIVKTQVLLT